MKDDYSRHPLQWPVGWKRTPKARRQRASFHRMASTKGWTDPHGVPYRRAAALTVADGLQRVAAELKRFGVPSQEWVVSTNVPTRLDGLPYSNATEPADPGVAVYFRLRAGGRPKVFACDKWTRVADNLAAIAGHIAALRAVERYGVGETEQVLAGYTALPPSAEDWRSVFGFGPDETPPFDAVDARYRERMRVAHPDLEDGNPFEAARLNQARDMARDELQGAGA